MGFIAWIVNIVKGGVESIGDVVEFVRTGLSTLWRVLTSVGRGLRGAYRWVISGAKALGDVVHDLALETYRGIRDLAVNVIPDAVRGVLGAATRFAQTAVGKLREWAEGALGAATRFLQRAIDRLAGWARDAIDWVTDAVRAAVDWVRTYGRRIVELLTSPLRFAAWVFGAILQRLLRWLADNTVRVARALFAAGRTTRLENLDALEDDLSRLF